MRRICVGHVVPSPEIDSALGSRKTRPDPEIHQRTTSAWVRFDCIDPQLQRCQAVNQACCSKEVGLPLVSLEHPTLDDSCAHYTKPNTHETEANAQAPSWLTLIASRLEITDSVALSSEDDRSLPNTRGAFMRDHLCPTAHPTKRRAST